MASTAIQCAASSERREPAIDLAHGVGERTASRHDSSRRVRRGRANRRKRRVEVRGVGEKTAAELYDRVDQFPWHYMKLRV